MTPDLDLTAAVEAAARATYEHMYPGLSWDDVPDDGRLWWRETVLVSITPAAPLIERQVRDLIAAQIEAAHAAYGPVHPDGEHPMACIYEVSERCARIARGEAS